MNQIVLSCTVQGIDKVVNLDFCEVHWVQEKNYSEDRQSHMFYRQRDSYTFCVHSVRRPT